MLRNSMFLLSMTVIWLGALGCKGQGLPLEKDMSFPEARELMLQHGWSPVKTFVKLDDGELMKNTGDARKILAEGFEEIQYCTGAGVPYCIFNYKKDMQCFKLQTIGEYDNNASSLVIFDWSKVDCKDLVIE